MTRRVKLLDVAQALGISTGTVHRALHNHMGVSALTKTRVLQMAKSLGYRPNLAGRYLSSKQVLRVSVNTLQGPTSFFDGVREGISKEARARLMENVEIEFRTYPSLGEGEEEAFEAALKAEVDGLITFPSRPQALQSRIRRASRAGIPVVCVVTDAPHTGRLAVVSIDTLASGSLAADLMGNLMGNMGKVAVAVGALTITEHAEKNEAFENTMRKLYPEVELVATIEDHEIEAEAYDKCRALFSDHPDLAGMYVSTGISIPVVNAARDAKMLDRMTLITTDVFPALVPEIRSRAVAATMYQRPRTQGRIAFRILHEFLVEGECPSFQITLAPQLVMRGNLDFFLQRQWQELRAEKSARIRSPVPEFADEYFG